MSILDILLRGASRLLKPNPKNQTRSGSSAEPKAASSHASSSTQTVVGEAVPEEKQAESIVREIGEAEVPAVPEPPAEEQEVSAAPESFTEEPEEAEISEEELYEHALDLQEAEIAADEALIEAEEAEEAAYEALEEAEGAALEALGTAADEAVPGYTEELSDENEPENEAGLMEFMPDDSEDPMSAEVLNEEALLDGLSEEAVSEEEPAEENFGQEETVAESSDEEAAPEETAEEAPVRESGAEEIPEEIPEEPIENVSQEAIFPVDETVSTEAARGKKIKYDKYHCFENREISWLRFNMRVLEEAEDRENPVAERLNFLSIYQSNLDEFFMVRVGSLDDDVLDNNKVPDERSGLRPAEQLQEIEKRVRKLYVRLGRAYQDALDGLKDYGVRTTNFASLGKNEAAYLEAYFKREIRPYLSPNVVGKRQPFPFMNGLYLYAVAALETKDGNKRLGIVPCTDSAFPRLIRIPHHRHTYMLTEELILHFLPQVFRNYTVKEKAVIRITRNADINTDSLSEETYGYRELMERLVGSRQRLAPVRMEYSRLLSEETVRLLCERLRLKRSRAFLTSAPMDLSFLYDIRDDLHGDTELFFPRRTPRKSPMVDESKLIIPQIEDHDVLLYYPYERMSPMLRMLEEAARDPEVLSIRMTLYRVAQNSEVVAALTTAAEAGKRVEVMVELKARFDEENNIRWSHVLEDAGCHVMYGVQTFKVHSKLLLITRRKGEELEYITQVGTGNYNEKTARLYTDLCYMTAKEEIGLEAEKVFNALVSGTIPDDLEILMVAPNCLENRIVERIDREIEYARQGADAYIGMKLNSVTEKKIMYKLMEASRAGVKIDLIVRGINCLRSGIPGETDNIRVISIVGRFLEHARIYIFGTPDRSKVYISSADMMTRNIRRRVEVAVPIEEAALKERVMHIFNTQLKDNVKARVQRPNGTYKKHRVTEDTVRVHSQEIFYEEAYKAAEQL